MQCKPLRIIIIILVRSHYKIINMKGVVNVYRDIGRSWKTFMNKKSYTHTHA